MAISEDEARRLAEEIAASIGIKTKRKRRLVVVPKDGAPEHSVLNAIQRDTIYQRIRDLGALYGLDWLIRQETMHVQYVIECLKDEELHALLAKLVRAEEAMLDGVPFVEVGLIRGASCNWVA